MQHQNVSTNFLHYNGWGLEFPSHMKPVSVPSYFEYGPYLSLPVVPFPDDQGPTALKIPLMLTGAFIEYQVYCEAVLPQFEKEVSTRSIPTCGGDTNLKLVINWMLTYNKEKLLFE